MTLGPDGNVWFTGGPGNGRSSDFVGRITPTGSVTEYLTPTQPSRPAGITAGADGNLWFNETSIAAHSESQVARVTPSGVITEFVIVAPNNFQNPKWNIVAGPDGNVWTSAYYGGSILDIATGASSACTASSTTPNPADVVHGTTETVSTTISNCAMKPRLMKLVSKTIPPTGCGSATSTRVNIPLQPRVQTTIASSFAAPACTGTYTQKDVLSVGGTVVGSSTVTYQVT